tara:strand:+ start:47 stop:556 length:510 start_codon:yes stop_codon:yes gene_type:complete
MDLSAPTMNYFNQTKNEMYQNSGYCDTRINKQILIIDNTVGEGKTFDVSLQEPLKIDSLCDIYLDNFTTFDSKINTVTNQHAFVISIDQFNIKSNSNNNNLNNKIVIPNETITVNTVKTHKARKMNYICSINPCTLTKISGNITEMAGLTMGNDATFRFIMELIIVARQ